MKGKRIVIMSFILILATIAILASPLSFPLKENELLEDTLKRASELYHANIVNYAVFDSKYSNCSKAFIYKFWLENGTEMYYAVSYYKHFLFPRYRYASYADYSRPDFNGVLLAEGMPYETAYDISDYALKYKDSTLNGFLYSMIKLLSISIIVFAAMLVNPRYARKNVQSQS